MSINEQIHTPTPNIEIITQIEYSHDILGSKQNKQNVEWELGQNLSTGQNNIDQDIDSISTSTIQEHTQPTYSQITSRRIRA